MFFLINISKIVHVDKIRVIVCQYLRGMVDDNVRIISVVIGLLLLCINRSNQVLTMLKKLIR